MTLDEYERSQSYTIVEVDRSVDFGDVIDWIEAATRDGMITGEVIKQGNITMRWTGDIGGGVIASPHRCWFKNPEEAMLFKLAFGGSL